MGRLNPKDKAKDDAGRPARAKSTKNDTPSKEAVRSVMDTLRELGGKCTDKCPPGHNR